MVTGPALKGSRSLVGCDLVHTQNHLHVPTRAGFVSSAFLPKVTRFLRDVGSTPVCKLACPHTWGIASRGMWSLGGTQSANGGELLRTGACLWSLGFVCLPSQVLQGDGLWCPTANCESHLLLYCVGNNRNSWPRLRALGRLQHLAGIQWHCSVLIRLILGFSSLYGKGGCFGFHCRSGCIALSLGKVT